MVFEGQISQILYHRVHCLGVNPQLVSQRGKEGFLNQRHLWSPPEYVAELYHFWSRRKETRNIIPELDLLHIGVLGSQVLRKEGPEMATNMTIYNVFEKRPFTIGTILHPSIYLSFNLLFYARVLLWHC